MLDGLSGKKEASDEITDGGSGGFYHAQHRDTYYKIHNAVGLGNGSMAWVAKKRCQMK